jgi:hypothetical protein
LNVASPGDCEALRKYFRTEDFPVGARGVAVEGIYDTYGQADFLVKLRFKGRNLEPVRLIVSDLRHQHQLLSQCTCPSSPERPNKTNGKCLQCGIRLLNITKEHYPSRWLPLQKEARTTKAFLHVYGWKAERAEKILQALSPAWHKIQNVALVGLYFMHQKKGCAAVAEYHVGCGGFYDLVALIFQIEKWLDLDAERTTLLVMQAEQEKSPAQITA